MNSPVPIRRPARSGARQVGIVVLRVVLTAIPFATIGILAWVPLLFEAIVSRRPRDWAWFGVVAVVSTGGFVLTGYTDDYDDWQTNTGATILVSVAIFASAYFLVTDLRRPVWPASPAWQPPYAQSPAVPVPPYPAGPPPAVPPHGRIGQVRAELDELSAYLREQRES
jgi:hypothetical protein